MDFLSLIKNTGAYRTVKGDKENGRLSHAYLIISQDSDNLDSYLKIFAKAFVCDDGCPCENCRKCSLIEDERYADVIFYPQSSQTVGVEEINALIEESYLKPVESDKKVFVIKNAQTMTAPAQNKLLKTLEEPPKGVHIILGATSEHPLLSTIKSRVKKLEIPLFDKDTLFSAMEKDFPDLEKLSVAIACGDGTVGGVARNYNDENLKDITMVALDTLCNMKSSKDVLEYSNKIQSLKVDVADFLSVIELLLRDVLALIEKREQLVFNRPLAEKLVESNFSRGSVIHALEAVTDAFKRKKANATPTMLIEWLLFQILEGKYKWQKL
ncbi:MAG: hypothetical protein IJC07_06295 [Clostridia bacterium]|nr:hypothetical protein [Clostridia bacterium]